jgi:hypothetical protein
MIMISERSTSSSSSVIVRCHATFVNASSVMFSSECEEPSDTPPQASAPPPRTKVRNCAW